MTELLLPGYRLEVGSALDRALLVKFMQRTYREMGAAPDSAHLAATVDQYLSRDTPLWWVKVEANPVVDANPTIKGSGSLLAGKTQAPIACLWLGTAIDQLGGDRHTHIFLLYVAPEYRRQGIATALMHHAEAFAQARGDRQIGLQVFRSNQAAVNLYQRLGFQTQSLWMVKPIDQADRL